MVNKGVIILGSLALGGVALYLATRAEAAPPGEYVCPYCGAAFDTYEELVAHVQTVHPGERIPLPIEWE